MKTEEKVEKPYQNTSRRGFIRKGSLLVASAAVVGASGMAISCKDSSGRGSENEEVSNPSRVKKSFEGPLKKNRSFFQTLQAT